MPIKFYDLVAQVGTASPYFSPSTTRIRLALLLKQIPFQTHEVTFGDLRNVWSGLDKPLGVERATGGTLSVKAEHSMFLLIARGLAPFIQKKDGSYLMNGRDIVKWLDETYPDRTCILLPDAPLPLDISSIEYSTAEVEFETFRKCACILAQSSSLRRFETPAFVALDLTPFFNLYAPKMVKTYSKEDAEYYTSDSRMGTGVWEKVLGADQDEMLTRAHACLTKIEARLSRDGHFLDSKTTPGWTDCGLYGIYRTLRATDRELAESVFVGKMGKWVEDIHSYFRGGLADVLERDPK
ncbi:hypothetical protein P7C70_g1108, partial [Phenoliferia sp. Uapishka_3]